jgi:Trk K+ transport system NAD-binding subunit
MPRRRPVTFAVLGLVLLIGTLSLITQVLFAVFEQKDLAFHQAMIFVVETMTTVGYGEQGLLRSPVTAGWAIFVMATGFLVVFAWLSTTAANWVSSRLQVLPPRRKPDRMAEHVIICGSGVVAQHLSWELNRTAIAHLIVDSDRAALSELMNAEVSVVDGNPRSPATLKAAGISVSRALISTLDDVDSGGLFLAARSLQADLPLYGLVERSSNVRFLLAAGATTVVSAKRLLGERLGLLALQRPLADLDQLWALPKGIPLVQVPVLPDTQLHAPTLAEAAIRVRTGATVLGLWDLGHFIPAVRGDTALRPGQVLVATGRPEQIERLYAASGTRPRAPEAAGDSVIVLGYGDVGAAAAESLRRHKISYQVLTRNLGKQEEAHWVEGDATDADDLVRAGITQFTRCIVALDDDDHAVFATLIARQLNPGIRIIARANSVDAVPGLYLAGADKVISVSEVAVNQLAHLVKPTARVHMRLDDMSTEQVPVPPDLIGHSLASAAVSARSGCLVLAVRLADGSLEINPDSRRLLADGEWLVVFGHAAQVKQFSSSLTRR